jgi:hypothetical protein
VVVIVRAKVRYLGDIGSRIPDNHSIPVPKNLSTPIISRRNSLSSSATFAEDNAKEVSFQFVLSHSG